MFLSDIRSCSIFNVCLHDVFINDYFFVFSLSANYILYLCIYFPRYLTKSKLLIILGIFQKNFRLCYCITKIILPWLKLTWCVKMQRYAGTIPNLEDFASSKHALILGRTSSFFNLAKSITIHSYMYLTLNCWLGASIFSNAISSMYSTVALIITTQKSIFLSLFQKIN